MSESYPGNNAGPPSATITIPTDGDDVDAQSVDPAFQQLADNDAYAISYYPDTHAGGTYTGGALLTLGNEFIFNGILFPKNLVSISDTGWFVLRSTATASYIGNGSILNLGDPAATDGDGFLVVQAASQIHVLSGGSIEFDAGSTLTAATALNSAARVISVGGGGGTVNLDCSATNTYWISGTIGNASYAFTLINAISGTQLRLYFLLPASTGSLGITHVLAGATNVLMASFSTTGSKYIRVDYTVVVDPSGPTTYLVIEPIAQP